MLQASMWAGEMELGDEPYPVSVSGTCTFLQLGAVSGEADPDVDAPLANDVVRDDELDEVVVAC